MFYYMYVHSDFTNINVYYMANPATHNRFIILTWPIQPLILFFFIITWQLQPHII